MKNLSLVHSTDADPGISRIRAGKGFTYRSPDGGRISGASTLDRIRSLAIPPAWTDVWISPDAEGHIQATGRDARGRKQYRYHPDWREWRDTMKFASLVRFAEALPPLRRHVETDLRLRGLPREKVLASIVWLLDNAMIRVGNKAYAEDNGSFGLTTLRNRHVAIRGSTLRFAFRGKSGREWKLAVADRRIARIVRSTQDLPGQALFQYLDDEGNRRSIGSTDVNAYIRDHAGCDFSAKDFRTWGGTVRAAEALDECERPQSEHRAKIVLNSVIDRVAAKLGNTRTICRRCYIHPQVVEDWLEGRLSSDLADIRRRVRRAPVGLDRQEKVLLEWLKMRSRR